MEKEVTIQPLSKNEVDFMKWFSGVADDYWESNLLQPIHHYMFTKNGKQIHISFSKTSIVCSLIKKNREKDIYKGYVWENCLLVITKVLEQ